jgi:hypothetical protein
MAAKVKVPVSKRALAQRISRALEKQGEKLMATRGEGARMELGDFYVIDVSRNFVTAKDVDLESLGRELGVLKPYEALAE